MRVLFALLAAALSSGHAAAAHVSYAGICEASAGAPLGRGYFAVATDEANVLRIYKAGEAKPIASVDLTGFTGFDKSDIEDAAVIGDVVYWISSHSFNKDGEDKAKRKILFATRIVGSPDGAPTLEPFGAPAKALRDPLAAAAGASPDKLNIEGLAATPDGALLIALRGPLDAGGRAIAVPLTNPREVVEARSPPNFGAPLKLSLEGRGVRGLARLDGGSPRYLVAAGPVADGGGDFAIFRWDGAKDFKRLGVELGALQPEVVIPTSTTEALLLSDDGDLCKGADDDPATEAHRAFRSLTIQTSDQ